MTSLAESVNAVAKQVAYKSIFAGEDWNKWAEGYIKELEETMRYWNPDHQLSEDCGRVLRLLRGDGDKK